MSIKQFLSFLNPSVYKKLDIAVTNLCNSRCQTCSIWKTYIEKPNKLSKELTPKFYQNFFKANSNINQITFTGGEPLLKKDIENIVFLAIDYCPDLFLINIITNAVHPQLTLKKIKNILDHPGIKKLNVAISLDGDAKTHNRIRGVKNNYQNAIWLSKQLDQLKSKIVSYNFSYTISKLNISKLNSFSHLIDKSKLVINFAQVSDRYLHQGSDLEFLLPPSEIKKEIRVFLTNYKIKSPDNLLQWIFLKFYLKDLVIPCVAGKNTFHLDPYGNVTECSIKNNPITKLSDHNPLLKNHRATPNCSCYTPCESYFGLITLGPRALIKAIF